MAFKDRLMIFKIKVLINGRATLSSLVRIESSRYADDLEKVITKVNSGRSIGEPK